MAGADVGDINHSHNLVAKLLPEFSEVVRSRIKRFMSSTMTTYWGRQAVVGNRQGHWVRRDQDIRGYAVSEAVDSLLNQPAIVPFIV